MTTEEFVRRLRESQEGAERYAAEIRDGRPDAGRIYPHLKRYVACKYFLEEAEMETDDILALGDRSTEKLAELRRGGVEYQDRSVGCTTAASAVTKKALLALSLGRALKVKLEPDAVAEAETIRDLAELCADALRG